MPTNKKKVVVKKRPFGAYFNRKKFWGCLAEVGVMAWEKIFKKDAGYVTKAKWLKLAKEIYNLRYTNLRKSNYSVKVSKESALNKTYVFVIHTPRIMFPNGHKYYSPTNILPTPENILKKSFMNKQGDFKRSIDDIFNELSINFDKCQRLEQKIIKEKK